MTHSGHQCACFAAPGGLDRGGARRLVGGVNRLQCGTAGIRQLDLARSRQLGSSILARREPCEHPASDRDPRVEAVLHDYVAVAIAMRDWQ